jgi:putative hydrolase of the HAD superfamily
MVGNSLPSDVLPVLAIGGRAVHIPHAITWALETVEDEELEHHEFTVLDSFTELPALLAAWRDQG